MGQVSRSWTGTEWQDYCIELLWHEYGAQNFQEMPDRHNGDRGIEGFSRDGCAFQCYAAEEPKGTKELYEEQRDKLTEDLNKLRKNAKDLTKMLGDVVIRRYMFMVHRHESVKLIEHASTKAAEVRGWGLSFVHSHMQIQVVTDDAYPRARDRLASLPVQVVPLEPPTSEEVAVWTGSNSALVQTMEAKLDKLSLRPDVRRNYVDQLLGMYLEGENALQRLRDKSPSEWSAVTTTRARKERVLKLEHPPSPVPSPADVSDISEALKRELTTASPALGEPLAASLAWSAVGEWLLRCPLDF